MYAVITGHELDETPYVKIVINGGQIEGFTRDRKVINLRETPLGQQVLQAGWSLADTLKVVLSA